MQFHKGYGEMTDQDVVWSYQGWGENSSHPRASVHRGFWQSPDGYLETPDPYTVVVNSGEPVSSVLMSEVLGSPSGGGSYVVSKMQSEEIGEEAANRDIAATGPWEFVEEPAGYWRMRAVEGHWRQTPYFEEWHWWEIPEESTRVAGFQTGRLDTFAMNFDSIPLVEAVPEAEVMGIPGAFGMGINLYGQWHVGAGTPDQESGFNPDLPWVSANPDPTSEEWARARMVRQAMFMAVDWEAIVDELFAGFGEVDFYVRGYGRQRHLVGDRTWVEYNPERARELLAEAGYEDGFGVLLAPVMLRPFEPLTCEAMATMWENELGLDVRQERVAYSGSLRPQIFGRTLQGITCHAGTLRLGPQVQMPLFHSSGTWNPGFNHPWLDERIERALAAVDSEERDRLAGEIGAFIFDNALTHIVPFTLDAVWPVGPRISKESWFPNVKTLDARYINGYEYIQHRE